jgi:hypothetical protein
MDTPWLAGRSLLRLGEDRQAILWETILAYLGVDLRIRQPSDSNGQ